MFATFKKLFGKKVEIAIDSPTDFQPGAVPPVTRINPSRQVRVEARQTDSAASMPAAIAIPLKSVLSRLPEALTRRVIQSDVGEAEIFIPTQKVLSQIAKGSVKISFGELRQMAPPGIFAPENDRDRTLVDIPLYEVLSRLDPSLLARHPSQRQVEVPPEVTGPFGGQTKVTFATSIMKSPPAGYEPPAPATKGAPAAPVRPVVPPMATPSPVRPAAPALPPMTRPVAAPVQSLPRLQSPPAARPVTSAPQQPQPLPVTQPITGRVRQSGPPPMSEIPPLSFTPAAHTAPAQPAMPELPPLSFTPVVPARKYTGPVSPIAPTSLPEEEPIASEPEPFVPVAPAPPVPQAFRKLPTAVPISPIAPTQEPEPAPIRFNPPVESEFPTAIPTPVAPAAPVAPGETRFLTVSLTELSQAWPEVLLKEIIQQNLSGSFVGLPFGAVEGAIKQGRIAFPWKAIRSWIKPPVPQVPSLHDTAVLELPMKAITPLFMAELKSGRAQRKVAIDETIPNLFTGSQPLNDAPAVAPLPAPVAAATPVHAAAPVSQKSPDTNYFRKEEEKPDHGTVFLRKDGTPGTDFLKRYATPNEIVAKAASLPGVEGAIIALPDGLLVASRIPPTMNADTIAAFLPQIFGRVTQCTRELRLGDLNNLNFTVGNVPWKIYRVGAIYFAVFGRAGEPLPTNQLVGIAAELDRKGK
jgi:predicted regulator of Ras-like GTPase activity (Roadblock/LC7/MglB family)